ncbi:phage integrase family protein, putative [Ketogulonicigenium robustum]|uniref:Phage integrase family protein, putative n=1 Tax=Ketogulonicigenium robustum TaxID=92947 RepID=A0A1W6NYQ2_9RHOB|nr:DUF6538 domain-containing protein [Ketogulonicigenium robustum]ARO14378.1 phage integrase family protein, putative [Ketogulonicigenium robustum]
MGLQNHTFRRGASYVWRKRVPSYAGSGIIQISLGTNTPLIARRLAMILSAESCKVFDEMASQGLTKDEARQILADVIRAETDQIHKRAMKAHLNKDPFLADVLDDFEVARARAYRLLDEHGVSALNIRPEDLLTLNREGMSDMGLAMVMDALERESSIFTEDLKHAKGSVPYQWICGMLGRDSLTLEEFNEGRRLIFRGVSAAVKARIDSKGDLQAESLAIAKELLATTVPKPTMPKDVVANVAPPAPSRPHEPKISYDPDFDYDPALPALVSRFLADKKRQGMSEQMLGQMEKVYALFSEATDVNDIRLLKQAHLAKFVDLMRRLPATYRKSPKDRDKPLARIIRDAPAGASTLSATTINRNLDYLGQLLKKAHSEGFDNVAPLQTNGLRERKTIRERDERPAFTADDVQQLFKHPVWQGAKNKKDWQEPGDMIQRGGLYWLPLIAALSGAKREDIAALKAKDIEVVDSIPALHIRPNANRGLKTLASTRQIPLHPQLVELGLTEHAAAQITARDLEADLFPDLAKANIKFGAAINHRFRALVSHQLGDGSKGKVFHSFRHYVATHSANSTVLPSRPARISSAIRALALPPSVTARRRRLM